MAFTDAIENLIPADEKSFRSAPLDHVSLIFGQQALADEVAPKAVNVSRGLAFRLTFLLESQIDRFHLFV
jgi:hypothetical protein